MDAVLPKDNDDEVTDFICRNIGNFSCGKGWHEIIKCLLTELLNAGWNKDYEVFGKEKFGGLRISFGVHRPDPLILNICKKYEVESESVCEICGDPGKHRVIMGWEKSLCTGHFLKDYPVIKVETVKLNKVFRVEFEWNYSRVCFYSRGFLALSKEVLYACFNSTDINYYALLKVIPKNKLEDKDRLYLEQFFSGLSNCKVCGFKAVSVDTCCYCNSAVWNHRPTQWPNNSYYATEQEYIKEMQMDWLLDHDDFRKLKTINETAFEQVRDHKILFTDDDLTKYVKEQDNLG